MSAFGRHRHSFTEDKERITNENDKKTIGFGHHKTFGKGIPGCDVCSARTKPDCGRCCLEDICKKRFK